LRQSSFSLVTVSGVAIGRLIGGAIIIDYLLMNTLVDLAYPLLDPRVRRTGS
jgi:peptide/nickel transport system permease protein